MQDLKNIKNDSRILGNSSAKLRNLFLRTLASTLIKETNTILLANDKDCKKMSKSDPMLDRLMLTKDRIKSMAHDLRIVASFQDPLGEVLEQRKMKQGMLLQKVRTPIGVVAVIYESRPNVTVDVVSLCIKSGNAVVLKGGKESINTNLTLVRIIKKCLKKLSLPEGSVVYIDSKDRSAVKEILLMDQYIDVVIPRGGRGLINFVRDNARMPAIETGAGVCHLYIDNKADIDRAIKIAHNAKTQRPSVCNALDTLLIHKNSAKQALHKFSDMFFESGVEVFADSQSFKILKSGYANLKKAKKEDFGNEYLSLKMSIKIVPSLDSAIEHINEYGSGHSEAIASKNNKNINEFLSRVDAACVYANASTRFTDGAEFGLGGEIGISTQKLHARGPMGINELTTYKWLIKGKGQIRK